MLKQGSGVMSPHFIDTASLAVVRGDARLRGGKGYADDLQQRALERSWASRCSSEQCGSGFHRDVCSPGPHYAARRTGRHGCGAEKAHALARRNSDRQAGPTRRGCRTSCLSVVGPSGFRARQRIRDRRRHGTSGVTDGSVRHRNTQKRAAAPPRASACVQRAVFTSQQLARLARPLPLAATHR